MDDEKVLNEALDEIRTHPIDREDITENAYADTYRQEIKKWPKYTDPMKQREQ